MTPSWYRWQEGSLILRIWAQPRAKRDAIVGLHGDFLKIKVTSPPTEGKANENIVCLLAASLGVAPSRVRLITGAASRDKTFCVSGPLPENICERLHGGGQPRQ